MIDPEILKAAEELTVAMSQSLRTLMREKGLSEQEIQDAFKGLAASVRFYVPTLLQTSDITEEVKQTKSRSCNRHDDCEKADVAARARGAYGASHCHDDECEDCFGC